MLLIVAHHYVVNSGLVQCIEQNPVSSNSIFYLLFGAWGKTGINCFVLITGYFMCKMEISLRKFLKLFLWVLTYNVLIAGIFSIVGYHPFGLSNIWSSVLPFRRLTVEFVPCFLIFYLCIPFLNILIHNMSKRQFFWLIVLLLFIYTLHSSIPGLGVNLNYVSWFTTLYFISAYLRLYPLKRDMDTKFWGWMTALSWGLSVISILGLQYCQYRFSGSVKITRTFFLIHDCNAILALTNGVTSFMWFKNLKIKSNRVINTIAASSFGVLLIHANSDTMRYWLWNDTLDCIGHYASNYFWLYAIFSVLSVYAACTLIDIIRIRTIEIPLINVTGRFCLNVWRRVSSFFKVNL